MDDAGSGVTRGDFELVQIVDAASADAARRSGDWLRCRLGCTQCCVGVFAISQLDAMRLRDGMHELTRQDPVRAAAVRLRVEQSVARLSAEFPGDAATGVIDDAEAFEEFANDETCPVLDPETGRCDLYAWRPMTCRVFGPPLRSEDGIGVCELNFVGASEEAILAGELRVDWSALEDRLNAEAEERTGTRGETTVAFALIRERDGH